MKSPNDEQLVAKLACAACGKQPDLCRCGAGKGRSHQSLTVPEVVADRYRVVSCVGSGGMGAVFEARQIALDRVVAIKVLRPDVIHDTNALRRFEQEARAASAITHPNLATVFDYGRTEAGLPYLVMEFINGISLERMVKDYGPLSAPRAVAIFIQVADALAAIHAKGVVHRDLKPSNVMLQEKSGSGDILTAKVVDFGIAKILSADGLEGQSLTQTGEVFGSPLYMSPEQCMGYQLDQRSDIYSLGCLMYEALSGSPPHSGQNPVQTIFKHVHEPPTSLLVAGKYSISAELDSIVVRCLEKDPARRYQSMIEVRRELEKLASGKVAAPAPSGPPREDISLPGSRSSGSDPDHPVRSEVALRRPGRAESGPYRIPPVVAGAAALALLVLAGIGLVVFRGQPPANSVGSGLAQKMPVSNGSRREPRRPDHGPPVALPGTEGDRKDKVKEREKVSQATPPPSSAGAAPAVDDKGKPGKTGRPNLADHGKPVPANPGSSRPTESPKGDAGPVLAVRPPTVAVSLPVPGLSGRPNQSSRPTPHVPSVTPEIPSSQVPDPDEGREEGEQVVIKHCSTGLVLYRTLAADLGAAVRKALKERVDLSYAMLERVELSNLKFDKLKLAGAELKYSEFNGAVLPQCNFSKVSALHAEFVNAVLNGADFTAAHLHHTRFTNAKLAGACFDNADLFHASLGSADLSGATFSSATLRYAKFVGANLRNAVFKGAKLGYAEFNNADLRGSVFGDTQLKYAEFNGANLSNVDLHGLDLSYCDFKNANLQGANLRGCKLFATTLRGADLTGATVDRESLQEAETVGAQGI